MNGLDDNVFNKLALSIPQSERQNLLEKLKASDVELTEDAIKSEASRIAFLNKIGYKIETRSYVTDDMSTTHIFGSKSILIVDDSVISLRTFMNILSPQYRVSVVKSGVEALKYLETELPDLILLDYEMPVMDGAKTLHQIRTNERTKDVPVFFLTGVTDSEWITVALSQKPNGYILKSTPADEIEERIFDFFMKNK